MYFRQFFFAKVTLFNPTCHLQQGRDPTRRLDLGLNLGVNLTSQLETPSLALLYKENDFDASD